MAFKQLQVLDQLHLTVLDDGGVGRGPDIDDVVETLEGVRQEAPPLCYVRFAAMSNDNGRWSRAWVMVLPGILVTRVASQLAVGQLLQLRHASV